MRETLVYYTKRAGGEASRLKKAWAAAAIVVGLWAPGCFGQADNAVTVDPVMSKGPAAAPVTIVEFSDYQ